MNTFTALKSRCTTPCPVAELQAITDAWLTAYNQQRPHDSLGRVPPLTFLPRPSSSSVFGAAVRRGGRPAGRTDPSAPRVERNAYRSMRGVDRRSAKARELTLVTLNTTEFRRVPGLKVEDWKGSTSRRRWNQPTTRSEQLGRAHLPKCGGQRLRLTGRPGWLWGSGSSCWRRPKISGASRSLIPYPRCELSSSPACTHAGSWRRRP